MSKIKAEADKEAVLLALDQLSQTMDVMRKVVGRLKRSIEETSAEQLSTSSKKSKQDQSLAEEELEHEKPGVLH
jgi:regulator of replication initiation timing